MRRCRSGRSATARWTRWRRTDSTASSAGSTDDSSANRSPSSESPSEPSPWFSEIESTASSASTTCSSLSRVASASSSDRRLAAQLRLQLGRGAVQLDPALLDVHRDADRLRLVRDRALAGLTDPPGRVGRELVALAPVELLRCAVEADDALLDQVEERHVVALVALRDRDDQAQVRVDHLLLRCEVAALDALRERDLVAAVSSL